MKSAIEAVKEWVLEDLLASGPRFDLDLILISVRDKPQEVLDWASSQMDRWVWAVDQGQGFEIDDNAAAAQAILDAIKVRFAKELAELPVVA